VCENYASNNQRLVIPNAVHSGARFLVGSPARAVFFACWGDHQAPE